MADDKNQEKIEDNQDNSPVNLQTGTEEEKKSSYEEKTGFSEELAEQGNKNADDMEDESMSQEAPFTQPENLGQQDAVGGSESAPETDDDVGDMARRVGLDYSDGDKDDGYENEEVNIAKKIDDAEKDRRGIS